MEYMMNREEILKKVTDIFREIFDDETLIISEKTNAEDIEAWDSIENINVIVAMEKEFGIKFQIMEIGKMENVGEMVSLIGKKLQKKN